MSRVERLMETPKNITEELYGKEKWREGKEHQKMKKFYIIEKEQDQIDMERQ